MDEAITIRIPGEPHGKGRARAYIKKRGRSAGRIGHYTPEKTRSYESLIADIAVLSMNGRKPFDGPVTIEVTAMFVPPASWPAWKRAMALAGDIAHTVKPDKDNLEKSISDGLNGIAWIDDCYVTFGVMSKQYAPVPAVVVKIRPTGQFPAQITKRPHIRNHPNGQSQKHQTGILQE